MTEKLKLHTYFQLILKIDKRDDFFLNSLRLQDMIIAITLLHEFTTNKIWYCVLTHWRKVCDMGFQEDKIQPKLNNHAYLQAALLNPNLILS